uniref:Uncharacterized protein n=1 Tax=Knipowitschia caucasica TaxID=637954 RepID=A0AAV2KNC5_KNICA
MTQAAAKMERKEENKSFTDVMDYDPDTGNCTLSFTDEPRLLPNSDWQNVPFAHNRSIVLHEYDAVSPLESGEYDQVAWVLRVGQTTQSQREAETAQRKRTRMEQRWRLDYLDGLG